MTLVGPLLVAMLTSPAMAAVLMVDDDRGQQPSAQYNRIQTAIDVAVPGDEIVVYPGLYEEQIVISRQIALRGLPMQTARVTIRPTALSTSRPSVLSSNPVTAAILIDSTKVDLSSLDVDLSASGTTGCTPLLAGVYYRNASGTVDRILVTGARVAGAPHCDSGAGIYVESGDVGTPVDARAKARAMVKIVDSRVLDYQKVGVAANGPRTLVRIVGGEAIGDGASTGAVQYGYQVAVGAKGKLQDVVARRQASSLSGRTAAGVLSFAANRTRQRGTEVTEAQTGTFIVGDETRTSSPRFETLSTAGAVLLGMKGKVAGGTMEGIGEAGVVLDGDRNVVRGTAMTDIPVGVCIRSGLKNIARGIVPFNVPLVVVEPPQACSATLQFTDQSVAPFLTTCGSASDCDDGQPCTTDVCEAGGLCSNTTSVDGTACSDTNACTTGDTCLAGVCTGGSPVANGTSCADDDLCDGTETCQEGDCTPGSPLQCDDGNACNGLETCHAAVGCRPGTFLFCDDLNVCNGIETCDPVSGCMPGTPPSCVDDGNLCNGIVTCSMAAGCIVFPSPSCNDSQECTVDTCSPPTGCAHTNLPDGTPCTGGVCTAGACG